METRDTILRLIQQTALILRAFFHQLPPDDDTEYTIQDFTTRLKEQTSVDLDVLRSFQTGEELQAHLELFPSFDSSNQEILADILVALAAKTDTLDHAQAYKKTALMLYLGINQKTQTHDWSRQEKIRNLQIAP